MPDPISAESRLRRRRVVLEWTLATAAAETVAVAIAAAVLAVSWPAVAGVIAIEALLLAAVQRRVLRRAHHGIEYGWFAATVAGTAIGRAVHFGLDVAVLAPVPAGPVLQIALAASAGALTGVVMALPQAYVLTPALGRRAWAWVAGPAGAWALAFVLLVAAAGGVGRISGAAPLVVIPVLVAALALIAAIVGLVEGLVLAELLAPVIDARDGTPVRGGSPSERSLLLTRELPLAPALVCDAIDRASALLVPAGAATCLERLARAGDDAFTLEIVELHGEPVFDGVVRIDEIDPQRARLVIVGRYAPLFADGEDQGGLQRRLAAILDRLAACALADAAAPAVELR